MVYAAPWLLTSDAHHPQCHPKPRKASVSGCLCHTNNTARGSASCVGVQLVQQEHRVEHQTVLREHGTLRTCVAELVKESRQGKLQPATPCVFSSVMCATAALHRGQDGVLPSLMQDKACLCVAAPQNNDAARAGPVVSRAELQI